MKTAILFVCVVAAITYANAGSIRVRRQLVPREFANINIENYLKNERAVAFQLKCIVYDGPCDRIGKYLKITIPELLTNQCRNCDPEQRMRAGRLVAHIQQNFPKEWEDAVKKFQGGQVKPEDAAKLETLLGVKLDPKLVGADASSTAAPAAPAAAAPAAEKVEAPSTVATTTTTAAAPTTAAPTTAAPVASSSEAAPVVPAASEAKSDIVAAEPVPAAAAVVPEVVASSEAPVVVSSSETPVSTSEAPKSSEAPAPAAVAETKA